MPEVREYNESPKVNDIKKELSELRMAVEAGREQEFKIDEELKGFLKNKNLDAIVNKYSAVLEKIVVSTDKSVSLEMKLALVEHIGDNLRFIRSDEIAREALRQARFIAEKGQGEPREIAQALVNFFSRTVK